MPEPNLGLCPNQNLGGFAELRPRWAANIEVSLGRLAGRTVCVIANTPLRKGRLPRLAQRREGVPLRPDVRRALKAL